MESGKIGRVSMVVEIDDRPCLVILPQDKMKLLVYLATSLSDTGKLCIKDLGDEYKLVPFNDPS